MLDQANDKRRHLVLKNTSEAKPYTAHKAPGGAKHVLPELNRAQHGGALNTQLQELRPLAAAAKERQMEIGLEAGLGIQIQFVSRPDADLAFEKLASEARHKGIELLSVQEVEGKAVVANVFVPDGQLQHFEKLVVDYLNEKKTAAGVARDNKKLLNTIGGIRASALAGLWMDAPELLPVDQNEPFWWEVWLRRAKGDAGHYLHDFRRIAAMAECQVSDAVVEFPERSVVVMYGSQRQLTQSVMLLNCVAELRRAKDTAAFFVGLTIPEQHQWATDLAARLQIPLDTNDVPRVCLLDSGVNRAHPLLEPLMDHADLHTVNPAWGAHDQANHGTGLAGLAAYGDLHEHLASNEPVQIGHRLESVKLTPNQGANAGDDKHHARLFIDAVTLPEAHFGERKRVFTSAVTATDCRDFGRPSAWSSTVDALASDALGGGAFPRLFVLSAGNIDDRNHWMQYPASLSVNQIHDPGQSWNALTVGAFSTKVNLNEPNAAAFTPIAPEGALSPFTTTSSQWTNRAWPLKPDVVFEGGNAASDGVAADNFGSLELLTTNNQPLTRLFWTTNATSAASALCARMAAQIMAAYPQLRPETVRALIVSSAEWTEAMLQMFPAQGAQRTKQENLALIKHCGWGVPDLDRALWSAGNSLSLVLEDQLNPYVKDGSTIKTREMNFHALPWPLEQLEALQDTQVEMRVTLSYFIEPNPSARGSTSKYHYPSHRLRFAVRRPLESVENFQARINAATIREEEGRVAAPADPEWLLGEGLRHRGSLHHDIWRGSAADLASRGFIGVYPANGWWRTRQAQERYGLPARYSLIVSIHTPRVDVDLYAQIEQLIAAQVAAPIAVNA
ncbi:MAG TPA: S8 family peptidase [Giesbergeria sp.]|nr:S8 family peptidase [Giesbergeria sp.]HNO42152.1 S8 family peptidase [Ottowia sp.]HNE71330.1 S8 family peptidase [Giesbergeria sp.]HNI75916.1 S8 family peptidase [Giesbergeria sp.]HNK06171.1 S8 family peptidase [Giesbergeria sp.]